MICNLHLGPIRFELASVCCISRSDLADLRLCKNRSKETIGDGFRKQ